MRIVIEKEIGNKYYNKHVLSVKWAVWLCVCVPNNELLVQTKRIELICKIARARQKNFHPKKQTENEKDHKTFQSDLSCSTKAHTIILHARIDWFSKEVIFSPFSGLCVSILHTPSIEWMAVWIYANVDQQRSLSLWPLFSFLVCVCVCRRLCSLSI